MTRALLCILTLAAAGAAGAAQPVGRLFFTPAERAQLDVARANKRVAEPPSSAAQKPAEPPPPETQIITYSGIVRRSDGKSILWLNSRAADEKEALSALPVSGRVRPDGGVTLQVPGGEGTIELKVGQRAELQTGRVSEARPPEKESAAKKAEAEKGARSDAEKSGKSEPAKAEKEIPRADAKAPPAKLPDAVEKKAESAAPRVAEPARAAGK